MTHQETAASNVETPRRTRRMWGIAWKTVALTLFAALVFGIALIATFPASVIREFVTLPPQVTAIYGSIWRGRAVLDGGYALDWDSDPWQLLRLRWDVDVTFQGVDTQLTGGAFASPWRLGARDITGRAGPGLLALFPGATLRDCTSRAVVDVQRLEVTRSTAVAGGVISIDAGSCVDGLGRTATIPQMQLDLSTQGDDARAVLTDRDGDLAQITVAGDRRLILRIEPEGAVLVPGMPTGGPVMVEYPF